MRLDGIRVPFLHRGYDRNMKRKSQNLHSNGDSVLRCFDVPPKGILSLMPALGVKVMTLSLRMQINGKNVCMWTL